MLGSSGWCRQIDLIFGIALSALVSLSTASARSEAVLYRFAGASDGAHPHAGLIADQSGNLFGTTFEGGGACEKKLGCGTVFELAPDGTETVLYAFRLKGDGGFPSWGLIADQAGNLYGTAGASYSVGGTVFEVTSAGVFTALYAFKGGTDGYDPEGGLVADQSGNLYGTTQNGGSNSCNCGTAYKVTPGGSHPHKVLYSFQGGLDSSVPLGPLVFDAAGDLYGTAYWGGSTYCGGNGCGTVFRLAPDGTETVLYAFRGGRDGAHPYWGGLIFDTAGNLYGTTSVGGGTGCLGEGCGTVFELAPDGTETVLSRFERAGDPATPEGGVIMDESSDLFGTTLYGGAAGCGTVFKIAPGQEAKALYSFACGDDGAYPEAGLLQDQTGNLYGTTAGGRKKLGKGTVFVIQK